MILSCRLVVSAEAFKHVKCDSYWCESSIAGYLNKGSVNWYKGWYLNKLLSVHPGYMQFILSVIKIDQSEMATSCIFNLSIKLTIHKCDSKIASMGKMPLTVK